MHDKVKGIVVLSALCLVSACASTAPPAARAAGVEHMQCDPGVAGQDSLVASTKVLRVDRIYSHVMSSRDDSEERVSGAKLLIRPPPGVGAEEMTRILQCHSARVLLGKLNADAVRNDPYLLPDTWVDIDVKPEDGNLAVTISADSVHDNLQVFSRASHYADDHLLATDPGLP